MRLGSVGLVAVVLWAAAAPAALAQQPLLAQAPVPAAPLRSTDGPTLELLLSLLVSSYAGASPTHNTAEAAVTRAIAEGVNLHLRELSAPLSARAAGPARAALQSSARLQRLLAATTFRFQPWPLSLEVAAIADRLRGDLTRTIGPSPAAVSSTRAIDGALSEALATARAGAGSAAAFAGLRAYALYSAGPGLKLQAQDPALDGQIKQRLLLGAAGHPSLPEMLGRHAPAASIERTAGEVRSELKVAEQALGQVTVSHATIVLNAAIIVFREGLEAILILAAITASFVGAKRHLRRPVLIGALLGLVVIAITWVIAQVILHALGSGGLELQAITGLIAIGVLLLVTNWFFHRVYWSEWISRFNRRRRRIERINTFGFISGQALGLALLGLSSVYREGLETVLFLQALETSAGTGATALGAGIGLLGTLIVGGVTFSMQRKLPFKRMLIVTGVLIALVLAVMVGTTVHNLQGLGWVPTTPTSFHLSNSWSIWLGVFPTWEGIGSQLGALVFVVGSYFAAREIQVGRPRRRAQAAQTLASSSAT